MSWHNVEGNFNRIARFFGAIWLASFYTPLPQAAEIAKKLWSDVE